MSGKSSKEKGKRGEREIVAAWRDIFPEAERQGWKQAFARRKVPDVIAGPFWFESKIGKSTNPKKAFHQANKDCPKGYIPIARTRDDKKPALVTLLEEDFHDLVKEWKERGHFPWTQDLKEKVEYASNCAKEKGEMRALEAEIEVLREIALPSAVCKATAFQQCNICDDFICKDNTNPKKGDKNVRVSEGESPSLCTGTGINENK